MDAITNWIVEFLKDSIGQVLFTVLALWGSALLFRWYVYKRLKKHVKESFKWYAIMLRTLEWRLRLFDQHLMKNPQWQAGDMTLRRLLLKGLADVEAVDVAGGAVAGLLDLPLVGSKKARLMVAFEASRARLLSELQRSMEIINACYDVDDIGKDDRYLKFLRGGPSPVTQGFRGTKAAAQGRDVRSLLNRHIEDCEALSVSYMGVTPSKAKELLSGEKYWGEDWVEWVPSLRAADRQAAS